MSRPRLVAAILAEFPEGDDHEPGSWRCEVSRGCRPVEAVPLLSRLFRALGELVAYQSRDRR